MNRMLLGSSVGVDDGKPHTVSVSRNGQSGLISLTVDQGNPSQTVVNQIPGQELQTMDVFLGKRRSTYTTYTNPPYMHYYDVIVAA